MKTIEKDFSKIYRERLSTVKEWFENLEKVKEITYIPNSMSDYYGLNKKYDLFAYYDLFRCNNTIASNSEIAEVLHVQWHYRSEKLFEKLEEFKIKIKREKLILSSVGDKKENVEKFINQINQSEIVTEITHVRIKKDFPYDKMQPFCGSRFRLDYLKYGDDKYVGMHELLHSTTISCYNDLYKLLKDGGFKVSHFDAYAHDRDSFMEALRILKVLKLRNN